MVICVNNKIIKNVMVITELFLFLCMICVFNISRINGADYMQKAVTQRKTSSVIKNTRGKIYDRNMISFVDSRTEYIQTPNGKISIPRRYDTLSLSRHIIGSVRSDGVGQGGLEEMYDHILRSGGEIRLNSLNDGSGKPIANFYKKSLEIRNSNDNSLLLTLDYHIQKIAEQELQKSGLKGAVCIMDSYSFSPLALATRKNYDQNSMGKYLNSDEGEFLERCTTTYDAGSIFKIITASSVLENNIVTEDFLVECKGRTNIDGVEFACHKKEGHGTLNMEQAFAKSCNIYFYELGNLTGIKNIYDTMNDFSLGQKILNLPWEQKGNTDILSNTHPNQIANISIGQGNLLMSPIQAVNMVNIIANDGIMKKSHLVSGIVGDDGVLKEDFRVYDEKRVISSSTSQKIKQMMRSVMLYGTGSDYNIKQTKICAKTGTAETGWKDGVSTMTHGWFVGFFPMEKPRYSIAVFLENGKSGYNAGMVFESITKELIRQGF